MAEAEGSNLFDRCVLFQALDEGIRRELVKLARRRSFRAGEPIFDLGSSGDSMMAVETGTVRISLPTPDGKVIVLADLPPGEVFGEIALLDGQERSANASALTKCDLVVLNRRDVFPLLERNPHVCIKLMQLLCARVRLSDDRMTDIGFHDLRSRLAKLLLRKANITSKGGAGGRVPRIADSQSELASMIGGTRETVNRCLRELHRQKIVELRDGWILVLQPDKLEDIANPM